MQSNRFSHTYIATVASLLLLSLVFSACSTSPSVQTATTQPVHVAGLFALGNRIAESDGHGTITYPVFHGVNRSGGEYVCVNAAQGVGKAGTFDGPVDQASVDAMLAWKITIVRVPLNEDCWLGINGEPGNGITVAQYRQAVLNYVNLLRKNKLMVILDLHWAAPGTQQAVKQLPMPDLDHAPAFWTSVAGTFKNDPYVLFDLFNEPYANSWQCWLNGSTKANMKPCPDVEYAAAGFQTLVNAVRGAGANNLIMLGGLAYANDFYGWMQFKPRDPLNNLIASFHIYQYNGCNTTGCLDDSVAPVMAKYPVLVGEIGEFDCSDQFINGIMAWFDARHVSYLAWAWDVYDCGSFPSLISSYDGTPTSFGAGYKQHLLSFG
jgi:hypothetical protein